MYEVPGFDTGDNPYEVTIDINSAETTVELAGDCRREETTTVPTTPSSPTTAAAAPAAAVRTARPSFTG